MKWLLDQKIERFKNALMKMGWFAEKMMIRVIESMENRQVATAKQVVEDDDVLDEMEVELRQEAAVILGTHAPTGFNLRFLISSVEVANIIEKIGDRTRRIAQILLSFYREQSANVDPKIIRMAKNVAGLLRETLGVMADMRSEAAFEICTKDDEIDEFFQDVRSEFANLLNEKPEQLERILWLLEIARELEEIADLCTNVVEAVLYAASGENYKCFKDRMRPLKGREGVLFDDSD
ncbi:MAG: phosphate signaling complex PhoU family protein [Thermotoga caldifontis]|uniref:phosphate signaling complex PhoU family protein n=1 Tax=Thermotoga caldifontis TaxID=1508419 RepID=UPI003C7D2052